MTTALQELETLPVPERVQLVEDLWDSIARSNAEVPIPQWHKDELARRKLNYLQNPEKLFWRPGKARQAIFGSDRDRADRWVRKRIR